MITTPFTKVQSVGNDFVLVHLEDVDEQWLPTLAEQVCRRHFAVGADGLLTVAMSDGEVLLRMFNPDGSEDFCGNGIRCAALYAWRKGWTGRAATIRHGGRGVETEVLEGDSVRSQLQPASFAPDSVPLQAGTPEIFLSRLDEEVPLVVSAVTTGSTHCVVLTDDLPGDEEFFDLGPRIEHHPLFPQRTSVIWAKPEGSDKLRIRIWERGAGETLGCGTGSSAAAAVFLRARDRHGHVEILNPGGPVHVEAANWDSPMVTVAEASLMFEGAVPLQTAVLAGSAV